MRRLGCAGLLAAQPSCQRERVPAMRAVAPMCSPAADRRGLWADHQCLGHVVRSRTLLLRARAALLLLMQAPAIVPLLARRETGSVVLAETM
jgi:hypothetical protein